MQSLFSPVSAVNKVGPKYKTLLEKLEIYTVEDLLYHFPFRYDDFSEIKKIKDLAENEIVTVQAVLGPVENIFTKYGKRITKAKVIDYTGEIEIIWFNQHYLKKTLLTGKTYNISGKVGIFNKKLCFISPEMEIISGVGNETNTGRLVPIYSETAGVSSKWIRTRINDVLSDINDIKDLEEFLPEEILQKEDIKNIKWSLEQIHFPNSLKQVEKARYRFQFEELFMELLNVEKRRYEWEKQLKGLIFDSNDKKIQDFIGKLPYELTKSQKTALDEIFKDVSTGSPMNRLLEGDVGTGKTLVALITAYLTHLNGYKTLYMAPTEILAKQHYETFKKLLPDLKIEIKTGSAKGDTKDFDILVGTHSILFSDEKYENIGFVIIDEQHRFGVEQRGKIIDLGKNDKIPHLLAMTATPIPRTLALTLYGDLSISVLKEHPNKERKITTKVVPENAREKAYQWIKDKNEPTFIVCPLIEVSESVSLENVKAAEYEYESLKKGIFKDVSVGLLHGRMKPKEKDEIIEKFKKGEIKVLVSTPVIEVGIDIPDATVIVLESAERYGLASLHQLRGRVGRGKKEGFCFVFMSNNSKRAYSRLKNLETVNNGLELAEIDMKIRGQGDVFGLEQHGFKKFKIATLDNLDLLEKAKVEAQKYYPKLLEFPKLLSKLTDRKGKYIPKN